jgi:tetratricopeptide (TPR) repeat protein
MATLDNGPADLDGGKGTAYPKRRSWRGTGEGCTFGILALVLVILVVELLLWRLRAKPAVNENRPAIALERPEQLNEAAWLVVRSPQAAPDAYARALEQAEAAVKFAPGNGNILNTLGVAQYRMGRYADALATLTKSEKMNATKAGSHPADLAFLAMAQHHLGHENEALAMLDRLHEVMQNMRWFRDAESRAFLREAEETLNEKPANEKK